MGHPNIPKHCDNQVTLNDTEHREDRDRTLCDVPYLYCSNTARQVVEIIKKNGKNKCEQYVETLSRRQTLSGVSRPSPIEKIEVLASVQCAVLWYRIGLEYSTRKRSYTINKRSFRVDLEINGRAT